LTSADLTQIRQSALGAADPLGVAAELADAAEAGHLADPQDTGLAFLLAAEIAESRAKLDAASRYVERALETYGTSDDSQVGAAKALRARIMFRTGHEDEAVAELEGLRPLLTQQPDAAAYVSASLVVGGRSRVAEQWLTEAVKEARADRDAPEPSSAEDAGQLFFLLQQRHRLRHSLGLPHDSHDILAERLETRLANAAPARDVAQAADDLLFWPQSEFADLVAQWSSLTEAYGATWDEHRARLERELVRLAGSGGSDLALLPGSVAGLTASAGTGDPADPSSRAAYARRLAAGTGQISWPPERNAQCWCGSGIKYKKCCLPRSRA
jgi:hypothetical protein